MTDTTTPVSELINAGCTCNRSGLCVYCRHAGYARNIEAQRDAALRELQSLRAKVGTHVLVPREPTLEMKVAGIEATRAAGNKSVASVYRAMLRAALEETQG